MSTIAAAALIPASRRPAALSVPRLNLPAPALELGVVAAPLLLMPTAGAPGDWLWLAVLLGLLLGADALTAAAVAERRPERRSVVAALLGAALWLATAAMLGTGPMLILGLYLATCCVRRQAGPTRWPLQLLAAALGTAVAVDLSLVTLGLERDSVWLGLGAAIGTACAAARLLAGARDGGSRVGDRESASRQRLEALLEMVLVMATVLVLGLYGTLLAHEPALRVSTTMGGYLGVPLLALALLRLALVALATGPRRGLDPLGALLLGGWALVTATLLQP